MKKAAETFVKSVTITACIIIFAALLVMCAGFAVGAAANVWTWTIKQF